MDNSTVIPAPLEEEHFCKQLLYLEIQGTHVRLWDVLILIPNLIFFFFLCQTCSRAYKRLKIASSPIFTTFYLILWVDMIASLVRCVGAMTLDPSLYFSAVTEKIMWVLVRFVLLSTEVCVIVLSLAFGHLDSKKCIFYVLMVTSVFSLAYSVTQGVLEISSPDESFHIVRTDRDYNLFGHGGMLYWTVTSVLFTSVYFTVFILPWTPLRNRLALPTKTSFYHYVLTLGFIYLLSSIGSGLLLEQMTDSGLCIVDVTTYLYFTMLTPLVYKTFLADFFSVGPPFLPVSYKTELDDVIDEENMSLPNQSSVSSLKTVNSDYVFQGSSVYDSSTFVTINSAAASPFGSPTPSSGVSSSSQYSPARRPARV